MFATAIRLTIALILFAATLLSFLMLAHVIAGIGAVGMAAGFLLVIFGGWQAAEIAAEVMTF